MGRLQGKIIIQCPLQGVYTRIEKGTKGHRRVWGSDCFSLWMLHKFLQKRSWCAAKLLQLESSQQNKTTRFSWCGIEYQEGLTCLGNVKSRSNSWVRKQVVDVDRDRKEIFLLPPSISCLTNICILDPLSDTVLNLGKEGWTHTLPGKKEAHIKIHCPKAM